MTISTVTLHNDTQNSDNALMTLSTVTMHNDTQHDSEMCAAECHHGYYCHSVYCYGECHYAGSFNTVHN
jgi:hypothetical protein